MSIRLRNFGSWNIPRIIVSLSLLVCAITVLKPVQSHVITPTTNSSQETLTIEVQQNNDSLTPENTPKKIIIPNLKIDLPVIPTKVINGYWQVPYNSAAFGVGSAPLNANGNTVIFAHARSDLFAPLSNIKIGDKIYIASDKFWGEFVVASKEIVLPTDTSVVGKTSEEILTLYTCSGIDDSKRLVVKAKKAA